MEYRIHISEMKRDPFTGFLLHNIQAIGIILLRIKRGNNMATYILKAYNLMTTHPVVI